MAGLGQLKTDIMRCVTSAKNRKGLNRCSRFAPGPGKPRGRKAKGKYRYTTKKGRASRAKSRRRGKR